MRRVGTFLFLCLASLLVLTSFEVSDAQAQARRYCTNGQSMEGRNACICQPPMKFLPGNICGYGLQRPGIQQVPNANTSLNVCANGQNAGVSGCRCTSPDDLGRKRIVYPGGQCNIVFPAGHPCQEGMRVKQTRCRCLPPLRLVGYMCVR